MPSRLLSGTDSIFPLIEIILCHGLLGANAKLNKDPSYAIKYHAFIFGKGSVSADIRFENITVKLTDLHNSTKIYCPLSYSSHHTS